MLITTKLRVTTIDEVAILHFRIEIASNLKSTETHNLKVNLILGKEWGKKANTICLPFDEKPKEKYLDMDVTVAGWGYTQVNQELGRGKLLL